MAGDDLLRTLSVEAYLRFLVMRGRWPFNPSLLLLLQRKQQRLLCRFGKTNSFFLKRRGRTFFYQTVCFAFWLQQLPSTEKSGALWLSADHQSWNKKTQGNCYLLSVFPIAIILPSVSVNVVLVEFSGFAGFCLVDCIFLKVCARAVFKWLSKNQNQSNYSDQSQPEQAARWTNHNS